MGDFHLVTAQPLHDCRGQKKEEGGLSNVVLLIESRGTGLNPLDAIVYYQFVQAFSNQVKFSAHHVTTTLNVPFVTYRKEKSSHSFCIFGNMKVLQMQYTTQRYAIYKANVAFHTLGQQKIIEMLVFRYRLKLSVLHFSYS